MSEEIQTPVQSKKDNVAEVTHTTPDTNKTWDQSEHDRAVADAQRAERAKYQDYDDLKAKLATAEDEAEKKALAEKSELERAQHELTKITNDLEKLRGENKTFSLKEMKSKVLSDSKYSGLPSVLKNAIPLSEDEISLQAEADKVLEEYQAEVGTLKQDFGKSTDPTAPQKKSGVVKTVNDLRERLNNKMNFTR